MKRLLLPLLLAAGPALAVFPAADSDPDMPAALAADPTHPGTLACQGSLFLELGRRAEAEADLARLAARCGDCPERTTLAREIARAR